MEAAIEHFKAELKTIRTGRANAQILDTVSVSYYGSFTPLKQMATTSVPEPTQILVQPFDIHALGDIRAAIEQAQLGVSLSDDGRVIRLIVPPLTTERREEMVKKIGKLAEDTRISLRSARGEAWEEAQKLQKTGVITEDNRDWARDSLDKLVKEYNDKIEGLAEEKAEEVRTI